MGCNNFGEWQISWSVISPVLDPGGLFKGYDLHKVAQPSTGIEEMYAVTLNYWLSKFVMEVAKKSGERYPPKTVYGIIFGIRPTLSGGEEWCRRVKSMYVTQIRLTYWLLLS